MKKQQLLRRCNAAVLRCCGGLKQLLFCELANYSKSYRYSPSSATQTRGKKDCFKFSLESAYPNSNPLLSVKNCTTTTATTQSKKIEEKEDRHEKLGVPIHPCALEKERERE